MVLGEDDDDGVVYHSLPTQKKRNNKLVHSLSKAVNDNRANARKH